MCSTLQGLHVETDVLEKMYALNSLRAELFKRNINMYLHFVSFLHIDMTQVLKILLQIR